VCCIVVGEVRLAASITATTMLVLLLVALCAVWTPVSAAGAEVAPAVTLHAALTPEDLGGGTTIHFTFTLASSLGQVPSPPVAIDLLYPENLGIATSGLGLANCTVAILEADGPPGCPSNSVMGFGSGLVEVPFGPELLHEKARTTLFMAPLSEGHITLLFFAAGESPVSAALVFPGVVLPADAPYGGDLATTIPLVPSVPEAPDAALVKFTTTLGPSHVTYYEYARGRRIPYHPLGIRLPRSCPRGGFRFGGQFTFQNETQAVAYDTVPCPRTSPRKTGRRGR
jgi:hypothetical protein